MTRCVTDNICSSAFASPEITVHDMSSLNDEGREGMRRVKLADAVTYFSCCCLRGYRPSRKISRLKYVLNFILILNVKLLALLKGASIFFNKRDTKMSSDVY